MTCHTLRRVLHNSGRGLEGDLDHLNAAMSRFGRVACSLMPDLLCACGSVVFG